MAEFDYNALRAALADKLMDCTCPACKHQAWDGGSAVYLMPLFDQEGAGNGQPMEPSPKRGLAVLTLTCERCGFVRPFEVNNLLGTQNASG